MKKILIALSCVAFSFTLKAQNSGFEAILFAAEDASKLTEAYVNPAMKGLITGMNSGWYHTAKVHKTLGFDISIGANISYIPAKDEVFNINSLGLTNTTSTVSEAATVAGDNNLQAPMMMSSTIQGQQVSANFNMPGGIKDDLPINAIPAPAVQVNVGLPYKFEVMLRGVPKVGADDVEGSMFGIGLKKEITSWFGPLDKLPLHVSLLGAYTNMTVDYDIANNLSSADLTSTDGKAEFKLNSYTVQAIASLNFPVINVYGGVGYAGGSADIGVLGNYNVRYNVNGGGTITETLTNPINNTFSEGGFRGTLGARLSLGFFKVFADYTLQNYNTLNAGIAFSFR